MKSKLLLAGLCALLLSSASVLSTYAVPPESNGPNTSNPAYPDTPGDGNGGQRSDGSTSSGRNTHVNTGGVTPGAGNGGITNSPPAGVSPGTGASPNPIPNR